MDNLTHTLVGAALGEAGLKHRTRLGMATLMIAANLPDVDVLAIPFGDHLAFRRGWTHGPVALVVLPLLLTALIVLWDRVSRLWRGPSPEHVPVRPPQVLLLAAVGVLSHPFLDWLNSYGIRLLMPFSHEWFYGDAIFIMDPWIWLVLGLGVLLSRRRRRNESSLPRRPASVALGAVAAYIAVMVVASRSAERVALREVAARGESQVHRLMAGPVAVNPLRRALIYDTGDAYGFGALVWTPRPQVTLEAEPLPKGTEHPAVPAALQRASVQRFLYWSRFPFFSVTEQEGHFAVEVNDARFSRRPGGGWMARSVIVERGAVFPGSGDLEFERWGRASGAAENRGLQSGKVEMKITP